MIGMQHIHLKKGVKVKDLIYLHPRLFHMFGFVNVFCHLHNVGMRITSIYRTPEENKALGAKSKTHCEYRAFDMSLRVQEGWNFALQEELKRQVEFNYKNVGAFNKHGESRPIVIHSNAGDSSNVHAHFQIRRNL